MNATRFIFVFLLFLSATAKSAFTSRQKVYQNMALAGSAGVLYGILQPENRNTYGLLYGSLGSALAAVITLYYLNPDLETKELANENRRLKASLDQFQNPKVLYTTPGTFHSKIPEKYRKLVQPGEWRVSEIDQWIEEGENRIIHQDKIMELVPPSLIPNNNGENE